MQPRLVALILAIVGSAAWDSRNVSDSEWICNGALDVAFGSQHVSCSSEVLQDVAQAQPTVTYTAVNFSLLYTLIIVDRDAPSMGSPTRSPLRHYAAGNIPAAILSAGAGSTVPAWFNYSGPQPPNGSLCHRYYVMLYAQAPGTFPTLVDPTSRYLWDFPVWAANNSLTKIAVNYWETQNLSARTAPCGGSGGGSGDHPLLLSVGAIAGIAVAGAIVVAIAIGIGFWALRSRMQRKAGVANWEDGAGAYYKSGAI